MAGVEASISISPYLESFELLIQPLYTICIPYVHSMGSFLGSEVMLLSNGNWPHLPRDARAICWGQDLVIGGAHTYLTLCLVGGRVCCPQETPVAWWLIKGLRRALLTCSQAIKACNHMWLTKGGSPCPFLLTRDITVASGDLGGLYRAVKRKEGSSLWRRDFLVEGHICLFLFLLSL